jgi:hypothetical protein
MSLEGKIFENKSVLNSSLGVSDSRFLPKSHNTFRRILWLEFYF